MSNNKFPLEESFKQQNILFYALVAGVVMIGLLALVMNSVLGLDFDITLPSELLYIAVVVVFCTFFIADYVFKQMLSEVDGSMSLEEKVSKYRSAAIIKYAFIEGAALLVAMAYIVSGNYQYFALLGVAVGYFLFVRPTLKEMTERLNLSYSDKQKLGFE